MKKRSAKIIVGLGFGDEGKGTMTSYFCQNHGYDTVVFYNGGAQRAHNVITDDGIHHTFSQIGSGSFTPGVKTILSRYTLLNPLNLMYEAQIFSEKIGENILNRIFIDENTPIITIYHIAMNQFKEWVRHDSKHGSCGQGIGELAYDLINFPDEVILAGELKNQKVCEDKLNKIKDRKFKELNNLGITTIPEELKDIAESFFRKGEQIKHSFYYAALAKDLHIVPSKTIYKIIRESNPIFEGSQGILLDEKHGFAPYTTWTNTLPTNAYKLLEDSTFGGDIETIGVIRTYYTRHGNGPFPSEDNELLKKYITEQNNLTNQFQGNFRLGCFDNVLFRYAKRHIPTLNSIALTHTDIFNETSVSLIDSYRLSIGDYLWNLPLHGNPSISDQEEITTLLSTVNCDIRESFNILDKFIEKIEEYNDIKVKYISFGPKTSQKREII